MSNGWSLTLFKVNLKSFLYLILFVFILVPQLWAESNSRAWVSKNPVYLGEKFTYYIEVESDVEGVGELPYTLNSLGVFEPGNFEYGAVQKKENKYVQRWSFELNSFLSGNFSIPPQIVLWKSQDSLLWADTVEVVPLEVMSNINTEMIDIYESDGIIAAPFDYVKYLLWIGGILLVVALVLWIVYRKKKEIASRQKTPYEIAQEKLLFLLSKNLLDSESIEDKVLHFAELAQVFREYIENEIGVEALESTSSELIQKLKSQKNYPKQLREQTRKFLSLADNAKFARYTSADSDAEFALEFVKQVLQQVRKPAQKEGAK